MFHDCSSVNWHEEACPYYETFNSQHTYGIQFPLAIVFLNGVLKTSFTVTRSAGGCSISPSIHFRPTVPRCSPAFALLDGIKDHYHYRLEVSELKDPGAFMEETLLSLKKAFTERRASPYDTDPDGNTLLYVFI
jgi:hypothetical protein